MSVKKIASVFDKDIDAFKQLYFNLDVSLVDILNEYNLPVSYADNLRKYARTKGFPSKTEIFNQYINSLDIESIKEDYLINFLTSKEISKKYGISLFTFNKITSKFNIRKSKNQFNETVKRKNIEKYGVSNVSQLDEIKSKKNTSTIKYTIEEKEFLKIYEEMGNTGLMERYNISKDYVTKLLNYFDVERVGGLNSTEKEIRKWLQSIVKSKIIFNDRKILEGKEIDFYIPSLNFGLEYNGLFWHNDKIISKSYHWDKTKKCLDKQINLYHIFENEWILKKDIVKSIIKSKLGLSDRTLFARKCEIREVDTQQKNTFLDQNHIQGKKYSSVNIGLFYDGELVQIMTFHKSQHSKFEYELARLCSLKNTQVVGGASRLFKYFIKKYNPQSVLTFADIRYSPNNSFYESLGFEYSHRSSPNYFYFHNNNPLLLFSRNKFQKSKLSKIKDFIFNEDESEAVNMYNNKYLRIWDCGNYVYGWYNKK